MKSLQVHAKPSFLIKGIQLLSVLGVFIILYSITKSVDLKEDDIHLTEGVIGILVTIVFVVFLLKYEIILTPKKQMYMNHVGLSITKKGEEINYSWKEVQNVILVFRGVRFYIILRLHNEKEVEYEFSEMWFYAAFNSPKSLKHNHEKLMTYYGELKEFTSRIELQHYNELVKEYNLTPPKWFTHET